MRIRYIFPIYVLFFLLCAEPAFANIPPSPHMALALISMPLILILFTVIGGGYVVIGKKPWGAKTVLVLLGLLLSLSMQGCAFIFMSVIGVISIIRGLKMIMWAVKSRFPDSESESLKTVKFWSMFPAGFSLLMVTVFLVGMFFAFSGFGVFWYTYRADRIEEQIENFVSYQIAYSEMERSKTGESRFLEVSKETDLDYSIDIYQDDHGGGPMNYFNVVLEYGKNNKSFVLSVSPKTTPFFPYNYLTLWPVYRADSTGSIRMQYVNRKGAFCSEDAPVVIQVDEGKILEMKENIINDIKQRKEK